MRRHIGWITGFLVATIATGAFPLRAVALEDGDTIKIVVPYSAGGGYDIQARMLAPYVEDSLRKNGFPDVTVIVENVTGGSGAIATATVYGAEPDGTTLLFLDPETSLWQQTLSETPFDITQFSYIGQHSLDPLALSVRSDLGIDDFAALEKRSQEQPILMGTSGEANYDQIFPMIVRRMLEEAGHDLRFEYIPLAGTSEIMASMRRGEAEGTIEGLSSFLKLEEEGTLKFLLSFASEPPFAGRWPDAKEVLGLPDEKFELLSAAARFRRVYVGPPGMSDEELAVLRAAFEEALTLPELVQKAEEANRPVGFVDGEQIQVLILQEAALARAYGEYVKNNL